MCLRVCVQAHRLDDSYLSLSVEPWNQIQLCGWIGVPSPWALTSLWCYSRIIHQGHLVRKKQTIFFFSPIPHPLKSAKLYGMEVKGQKKKKKWLPGHIPLNGLCSRVKKHKFEMGKGIWGIETRQMG